MFATFTTEEEFVAWLGQNRHRYAVLLDSAVRDVWNQNEQLRQEIARVETLLGKKTGVSSVHKGACDEKYVSIVLRKALAGTHWVIDDTRRIKKMDMRITAPTGLTIGIECKDKAKVTAADVDKFRRDKALNNYYGGIFVSTSSIPNVLVEENSVAITATDLWVFTRDPVYLQAALGIFIQSLPPGRNTPRNHHRHSWTA